MSSVRPTLRRWLAAEDGFALPVALAVLTVTLGLAAVSVSAAIDTSTTTARDYNAKAAIAAADAGARVAAFRLTQYQPASNSCPTVPTSQPVDATGLCPMDGPEPLGNGASFEYWVSRAMVAGDKCAGPVVDSSQAYMVQRCITAVGTIHGVSERIQQRVAEYVPTPVFPTAIFGTKSVTISNNETITTDTQNTPALLGTNGTLTVGGVGGGTTTIDGFSLPPGASQQIGSNVVNNGPTTGRLTPYPVPTPVNPGNTATNTSAPYDLPATYQGGTCQAPNPTPVGWVQTNCNYRLLCPDAKSCDTTSGGVVFDLVNRTLYLGNNASVVLGGGYYNFCSLYLSNNSQISIAPGAQAFIYIDSPGDVHSGCSSSASLQGVPAGTFTMQQNSTLNAGASALNAQVYVYGDPSTTPPNNNVAMTNNGSSSFSLVAPYSNVNLSPSNNTIFRGAIVGYTVTIGNAGHFTYEADVSSLATGAVQIYYRSYWEQCAGPGTPAAPTTGC